MLFGYLTGSTTGSGSVSILLGYSTPTDRSCAALSEMSEDALPAEAQYDCFLRVVRADKHGRDCSEEEVERDQGDKSADALLRRAPVQLALSGARGDSQAVDENEPYQCADGTPSSRMGAIEHYASRFLVGRAYPLVRARLCVVAVVVVVQDETEAVRSNGVLPLIWRVTRLLRQEAGEPSHGQSSGRRGSSKKRDIPRHPASESTPVLRERAFETYIKTPARESWRSCRV